MHQVLAGPRTESPVHRLTSHQGPAMFREATLLGSA